MVLKRSPRQFLSVWTTPSFRHDWRHLADSLFSNDIVGNSLGKGSATTYSVSGAGHERASPENIELYGGPERQLHFHAKLARQAGVNLAVSSFTEQGTEPEFLKVIARDSIPHPRVRGEKRV